MAVTTRINDFPTWYGGPKPATLFGYPVPKNIRAVDHSFDVVREGVTIAWATYGDPQDKPWHHMEVSMPITEEQITALLVAMKLSC